MQLDPTAVAAGVRHIALDAVGSTNVEALSRTRGGASGPLWITARSQSAGRGRRGSRWTSPPGNLYATLLLNAPSRAACAPQLSFVAALAVHDAIATAAPALGPLLELKWPNDVLLGGAKLAGLLIEGETEPELAVAIGIGVNCVSHPFDTAYPATNLKAAGALVSPAVLFGALSAAMLRRLAQWRAGEDFAAVRAGWLARAAGLGQDIRVRLPDRELCGRFHGLDAAGRLLVEPPDRPLEAITAGEVFSLGGERA